MRPAKILVSVVALVGLVCCSSAPGRDGFGDPAGAASGSSSGAPSAETFSDAGTNSDATDGPCTEDVDVVLVLDVSSSMGFVLDKLDGEIDKVVAASNALKA